MPTYIDGIASSQTIDTAGEIIDIKGLDCSSLEGAALNWEHKSESPNQLVGKILKWKKVFSEQDCEDDRQKYFWDKYNIPFLYILGRLFDDKKDSSKEAAALFLDDAEHPNEKPMVGFSVEGAKISKTGPTITNSIARRVTVTHCPANKTCVAEIVPTQESAPKDDLSDIFKSEPQYEIELIKINHYDQLLDNIKKADPMHHAKMLGIDPVKKFDASGSMGVGAPSSASGLLSSEKKLERVENPDVLMSSESKLTKALPTGWTHSKDEGGVHFHNPKQKNPVSIVPQSGKYHVKQAGTLVGGTKGIHDTPESAGKHAKAHMESLNSGKTLAPQIHNRPSPQTSSINKALGAGSGMGTPGTLAQGAALGKESLERKTQKVNRSKWLTRAEEEYSKWDKKEEFRKYMVERMPHLSKGEVDAIGQVLALNKAMAMEKAMAKLNKIYAPAAPIHSFLDTKLNQKEKVSSVPAQMPAPCLTLSEEMSKFDDTTMVGPMAEKEKSKTNLRKDSDIMMASEKKK